MKIQASMNEGTATLIVTTVSSTSRLVVEGAQYLADDLEQFLTDPNAKDVERHYRIVPDDKGVSVQTAQGGFTLPWRHIMTTVNGLRA
ncbi:hypothetical protein [Oceaniglobus indicus]|uniref:hypothetical protein n=1 Tax=Oceaniglobus indicus TaxID=2047749 RepID=UPI0011AB65E7|nr:hypothetical protein [Oceaniglobus indicus]